MDFYDNFHHCQALNCNISKLSCSLNSIVKVHLIMDFLNTSITISYVN